VEKTDEAVALEVQNGDREAFGVLIARYEPKMTRYAQKFLFRGEDVKDIVQEVFIKAYVNILSFDPQRRFSPWLYRIAHNEFINAIKKKTRLPLFAFDLDVLLPHLSAKETAEQRVMEGDMKQLLDTSLGKIDPKYREPLVLYYIQELDYKEIAEVLQIPVSTVGVRLNRAKVLLRKTIQKDHPDYESR
jgi:RNA polymerase sigma factor (sigma-70 family)